MVQADHGGVTKQIGPDPFEAGAYRAKLDRLTLAASGLGTWDRPCHHCRRSLCATGANYSYIGHLSRGAPSVVAVGPFEKRR
jgi:hypothetical protein